MRTVNVRIGHNDDFVIPQVIKIKACSHANAQCLAQIVDFRILPKLI